jgi:hypothetical protein
MEKVFDELKFALNTIPETLINMLQVHSRLRAPFQLPDPSITEHCLLTPYREVPPRRRGFARSPCRGARWYYRSTKCNCHLATGAHALCEQFCFCCLHSQDKIRVDGPLYHVPSRGIVAHLWKVGVGKDSSPVM